MRQFHLIFAVTAMAVSGAGCGQFGMPSSSTRGGMAVVDLDKVAAETGRDRQLAQSLELVQNSLNQSYAKTLENAQSQLKTRKKEYGEELSESEKKEFAELERSAINQLSQIQNKARAEFEAYKQKQIAQFRAELKPITQEIAAKRGLSIVIPKNDGLLLSVDPGVDITDDVVKVLREKHPVVSTTVPPTPAAQAVPEATPTPKQSTAKRGSSSGKSSAPARTANRDDDADTFR